MADQPTNSSHPGVEPDRINIDNTAAADEWAKKLNVSHDQLREAVAAVGDKASDIEMHLKGSRSTTNSDRVKELGG